MKKLIDLGLLVSLLVSVTACGQNNNPNATNSKDIKLVSSYEINDEEKKIDDLKWSSFKDSFNKRTSIKDKVNEIRVNNQMESIKKEFNLNKKKKISLSDIIDPKKWEEFQIAFRNRIGSFFE